MLRTGFFRSLSFRVIIGLAFGVAVGVVFPVFAASLKPVGDAFIKMIRMMIGPIVFLTVVIGIANMRDLKKLGRVGLKALLYFEVVTTFALALGYLVAKVVKPGAGITMVAGSVDAKSAAEYASSAQHKSAVDLLLNIIPDTFIGALTSGEVLQVLFIAILVGIVLIGIADGARVIHTAKTLSDISYRVIALLMEFSPLGAFGAMAFTIGKYGLHVVVALGKLLLCVYGTCIGFIFIFLWLICRWNGIRLLQLLSFLREELLIVLGTSSSEPALPGVMRKLEYLGCANSVVGLVIPTGYSFNLDGTSIYLTVSAIFLAQATGTHLTFAQEAFVLLILMVNSKGAAAVTGGGFITLAATLSALGSIPVTSIALLLGIDRFMSQCRSVTNLIGNAVATIVIARSEREFDQTRAIRILAGPHPEEEEVLEAGTPN